MFPPKLICYIIIVHKVIIQLNSPKNISSEFLTYDQDSYLFFQQKEHMARTAEHGSHSLRTATINHVIMRQSVLRVFVWVR